MSSATNVINTLHSSLTFQLLVAYLPYDFIFHFSFKLFFLYKMHLDPPAHLLKQETYAAVIKLVCKHDILIVRSHCTRMKTSPLI